ncbi:LacI family DNA-binding transcriptional regulator [Clostridium estertheticum]|uniref:LacI family DNA-binding transcriptional regulator n=1 Tax=Clostridium estertheticum TaxID=238834 RepID=UPI0013E90C02|nr:LacI family DNA-binding transcriptional regulator [Clostridium estertheticum]MBZ9685700.1 LacI family DNA-binding transcriptional regulator [Clostridium estertheticum]
MSKITLENISQTLGISKNTVSKALRGAPGVSDELRHRIIHLASEIGYTKIVQSPGSSLNNITVIGRKCFLAEVTFWPKVLYGITHYASERDIKISITNIDETKEDNPSTLSSIISHSSDGYIIIGTISDLLLKKIVATKVPTVVVDHLSNEVDCDYINSSNKNGIYKAVKHLYQTNHRNIGFIGNSYYASSFEERYRAYLEYMKGFSLPVLSEFVWLDAEYFDTQYYKNKIDLYKTHKSFPTAWVCVNDKTALTFMNALMALGIKVPDDMSIVGFDDIPGFSYPGLTTIEVPKQSLGEKAVEQILYRAQNPEAPYVNIVLITQLIHRGTVKSLSTNVPIECKQE